MKANELMIGDWVYFCHNDEWDTKVVGKVSLLSCGNSEFNEFPHVEKKTVGRIQVEAEDDFQFWQTDEGRNFEPIPLTPEILKKNGFEESEIGYKIPNSKLYIIERGYDFEEKRWSIGTFEIVGKGEPSGETFVYVNSVHELQHVLKLCKIEKEIVL